MAIPVPEKRIAEFENMGLGLFIHFGMYSQLGCGEWIMNIAGMSVEQYSPLKDTFTAKDFDAKKIVEIAKAAGMKYINITTKHHDGFCLYDSKDLNNGYDTVHNACGRDLIRELVDACNEGGLLPIFYHATLDWKQESFENDFPKYLQYLNDSVELLCTQYGKIGGLWFDGNWSRPDADWQEDALYSMIRHLQPEAMIINNTGLEKRGAIGNEHIDSVTYERGLPTPIDRTGMKKYVAGEMCETLNDHWGDADDINFKPVRQIVEEICDCRKIGANMLLNVGPDKDGYVPLMSRAIMSAVGQWMRVYGKAIYNGRPFIAKEGVRDFVLRDVKDEKVFYAFKYDLGIGGDANVTIGNAKRGVTSFDGFPYEVESVHWMDNGQPLDFAKQGDCLTIACTGFPYGQNHCVRVCEIRIK